MAQGDSVSKFLGEVYATARTTGLAHVKMVNLLKSGHIDWTNEEERKIVALEFQLGRMAAILGLKTRGEALLVRDLKAPTASVPFGDDRRTDAQQKAYRASVSAWEHAAREAGMERVRQAQEPRQPAPKVTEDVKASGLVVPHVATMDDVREFLKELASLADQFQKSNAKLCGSEVSRVLNKVRDELRKVAKPISELADAA